MAELLKFPLKSKPVNMEQQEKTVVEIFISSSNNELNLVIANLLDKALQDIPKVHIIADIEDMKEKLNALNQSSLEQVAVNNVDLLSNARINLQLRKNIGSQVLVDERAVSSLTRALNGPAHYIREFQATRYLPGAEELNPVNSLEKAFDIHKAFKDASV